MNKTRLSLYYLIGYTIFGGAAVPFLPKTMVEMIGLMFVAPIKESVYRKDETDRDLSDRFTGADPTISLMVPSEPDTYRRSVVAKSRHRAAATANIPFRTIGGQMSDRETQVDELKQKVASFIRDRAWERYHSPKNLAMSISIEAAEIMEHFQWLTVEEAIEAMRNPSIRGEVEDEIADVMIYCLSLANQTGIDVSEAIRKKLEKNEGRFPVDRIEGFGVEDETVSESDE